MRANLTLVSCVGIFAAMNVGLMVSYGKGMLGPVPFELIYFFIGASFWGTVPVVAIPLVFSKIRLTLPVIFLSVGVLLGLCLFDIWCAFAASAGV
jgi:hypothetical protein